MFWIFIFTFFAFVSAEEWEVSNYPNPTTNGYRQCNMKSPASLCDPDTVFKESERYRINYELNNLESKTRQPQNDNFCSKKGIVAAIAIAKHIRGGSENAAKVMANDMLHKWSLDKQCGKSLVIVIATEDRKFWVARDSRVLVYGAEFTDLFNAQKNLFKQGNYVDAILNIIQGTQQKAISKQTTFDDGTSRGAAFKPSGPQRKEKTSGFNIFSKIPLFVWIVLILIIIPTLCCCCCIYFCCRRKSNNDNKRQSMGDENIDPEAAQRNNQNRGSGLRGLLPGINIGAAGAMLMNCLRSKNNTGTNETKVTSDYNQGTKRGEGYKDHVVEDSGGGGNW